MDSMGEWTPCPCTTKYGMIKFSGNRRVSLTILRRLSELLNLLGLVLGNINFRRVRRFEPSGAAGERVTRFLKVRPPALPHSKSTIDWGCGQTNKEAPRRASKEKRRSRRFP